MSSSPAGASFFFGFAAADRGTDFSAVLLRFGIGPIAGLPSSPAFPCFMPPVAARVSDATRPRFVAEEEPLDPGSRSDPSQRVARLALAARRRNALRRGGWGGKETPS